MTMGRRKRRRSREPQATMGARRVTRAGSRLRSAAVLVSIAVLAALVWWQSRRASERRGTELAAPGAIVPIPRDSLDAAARMFEAATIRNDLAEALRWQRRIAAALPTNPLVLRQLGETLHNHRFAVTLPDGRQHWLLRNSLVRAEWEVQVLRLFDSSAVVARDPVDRARAHYWKARSAESDGLPLDALAEYEAALAIVPTDTLFRRVRDQQRQKLFAGP